MAGGEGKRRRGIKGGRKEVEAPAQGAISAASFVKLMEFAKSCFDL